MRKREGREGPGGRAYQLRKYKAPPRERERERGRERGGGAHAKAELGVCEVRPTFVERGVLERRERGDTNAVGISIDVVLAGLLWDEKVETGASEVHCLFRGKLCVVK